MKVYGETSGTGGDAELLFALAELSFLHGQAAGKREHQMAAAVYAYAFLFPEGTGTAPGRFDPRVRLAAELYNWSLVAGFRSEDGRILADQDAAQAIPARASKSSMKVSMPEANSFVR